MEYRIIAGRIGSEFDSDRLHRIRVGFRRALVGLSFRNILPEDHLSANTKDIVKV